MELTTSNVYAGIYGKIVFWDLEGTQPRDYNYSIGEHIGLSYMVKQKNSQGETMIKVNIGGKAVTRTDASGRTNTEITQGRYEAWINEKIAALETTTRDIVRGNRDDQDSDSDNPGGGETSLFLLAGVAVVGLLLKFLPGKKKKK